MKIHIFLKRLHHAKISVNFPLKSLLWTAIKVQRTMYRDQCSWFPFLSLARCCLLAGSIRNIKTEPLTPHLVCSPLRNLEQSFGDGGQSFYLKAGTTTRSTGRAAQRQQWVTEEAQIQI